MDSNEIGLIGALGGAIIGGACSVLASIWAHKLEHRTKKTEEAQKITNEIISLRAEISQSWQIYNDELGAELKKLEPQSPLMTVFPIGKNPFPFFDSMPGCLTSMKPETVGSIFYWYNRAKGLARQTQDNNENISRALKFASEKSIQMQVVQQGSFNLQARADQLHRELIQSYAQRNGMMIDGQAIKELHSELSDKTVTVLQMLDQELSSNTV